MGNLINILDLCETGSRALGPGNRYVIWVQGCPFNCKGCITPEGIPITSNKAIRIDKIVNSICNNIHITGITISGGEPFMQASALVKVIRSVKQIRPELDVIVFSGFKLKELDWAEALELLCEIDVLIDGKYVESLNDNRGLRGSSNQKIHYLTERLTKHREYFENGSRNVEIHVYETYQKIIGVPNKSITLNTTG